MLGRGFSILAILGVFFSQFSAPDLATRAVKAQENTIYLPLVIGGSQPLSILTKEMAAALTPVEELLGQPLPAVKGRRIQVTTQEDELNQDGDCSLREALRAANTNSRVDACAKGVGLDVVMIPTGIYLLTQEGHFEDEGITGDLDILESVLLFGSGKETTILDGNDLDRVLQVLSPSTIFVAYGLSVRNGATYADWVVEDPDWDRLDGAVVWSEGRSALIGCRVSEGSGATNGGGIFNSSRLGLWQTETVDNYARGDGAGIYSTGNLIAINSPISRNFSEEGNGGALHNRGLALFRNADMEFNGADIYGAYGGVIYNAGDLHLQNATLRGGSALVGGSIYNMGALSLRNVHIFESVTRGTYGGAIWNEGSVELDEAQITDNSNIGINNFGGVDMGHSLISRNIAYASYGQGTGGGVLNSGTMSIIYSTIADNYAEVDGGGIYNSGSLTISHSTVSGNETSMDNEPNWGFGGGIYSSGFLEITNSTVSGNSSEHGGGGLYAADGSLTMNGVTVANNQVLSGDGGGVMITGTVTATITASLIALNQDLDPALLAPDCNLTSGTTQSLGYNLVGNPAGCGWVPAVGDLVGLPGDPLDPMLGPLMDNGGSTLTHALLPTSPAIDTVLSACLSDDQRGIARPQGPACDIGAYEASE